MHCIGSSLCLWIYTIINETMDTLIIKMFHKKMTKCVNEYSEDGISKDYSPRGSFTDILSEYSTKEPPKEYSNYTSACLNLDNTNNIDIFNNVLCVLEKRNMCSSETGSFLEKMIQMSPFLYPFSLEFR